MDRPFDVVVEEFGLESIAYVVDVDFGEFSGQAVVKAPSITTAREAGKTFLRDEYLRQTAGDYNREAYVNAHLAAEDEEDD